MTDFQSKQLDYDSSGGTDLPLHIAPLLPFNFIFLFLLFQVCSTVKIVLTMQVFHYILEWLFVFSFLYVRCFVLKKDVWLTWCVLGLLGCHLFFTLLYRLGEMMNLYVINQLICFRSQQLLSIFWLLN